MSNAPAPRTSHAALPLWAAACFFASGAAGRILSLEDPIRNAPVLLSELDATFPVAEGTTIVGPTLKMSWIALLRVDLGVFLELPGPSKIAVLGSARADGMTTLVQDGILKAMEGITDLKQVKAVAIK